LGHPAHRLREQVALGGQRPAAEAIPIEADGGELLGAPAPECLDPAALDDREDARRLTAALRRLAVEFLPASARPADGALDGSLLLGLRRLCVGAIVEADHDVGT